MRLLLFTVLLMSVAGLMLAIRLYDATPLFDLKTVAVPTSEPKTPPPASGPTTRVPQTSSSSVNPGFQGPSGSPQIKGPSGPPPR